MELRLVSTGLRHDQYTALPDWGGLVVHVLEVDQRAGDEFETVASVAHHRGSSLAIGNEPC